MPDPLIRVTLTFAVIAGTAASLFALLTWEVFRQSIFGRTMFVLTFFMSAFILYHAALLYLAGDAIFINIVESAVYTGLAIVVWSIAWTNPGGAGEGD